MASRGGNAGGRGSGAGGGRGGGQPQNPVGPIIPAPIAPIALVQPTGNPVQNIQFNRKDLPYSTENITASCKQLGIKITQLQKKIMPKTSPIEIAGIWKEMETLIFTMLNQLGIDEINFTNKEMFRQCIEVAKTRNQPLSNADIEILRATLEVELAELLRRMDPANAVAAPLIAAQQQVHDLLLAQYEQQRLTWTYHRELNNRLRTVKEIQDALVNGIILNFPQLPGSINDLLTLRVTQPDVDLTSARTDGLIPPLAPILGNAITAADLNLFQTNVQEPDYIGRPFVATYCKFELLMRQLEKHFTQASDQELANARTDLLNDKILDYVLDEKKETFHVWYNKIRIMFNRYAGTPDAITLWEHVRFLNMKVGHIARFSLILSSYLTRAQVDRADLDTDILSKLKAADDQHWMHHSRPTMISMLGSEKTSSAHHSTINDAEPTTQTEMHALSSQSNRGRSSYRGGRTRGRGGRGGERGRSRAKPRHPGQRKLTQNEQLYERGGRSQERREFQGVCPYCNRYHPGDCFKALRALGIDLPDTRSSYPQASRLPKKRNAGDTKHEGKKKSGDLQVHWANSSYQTESKKRTSSSYVVSSLANTSKLNQPPVTPTLVATMDSEEPKAPITLDHVLLDTGATHTTLATWHGPMTDREKIDWTIHFGNGSQAKIKERGRCGGLVGISVCEDIKVQVVSVSQLASTMNCPVVFTGQNAYVLKPNTVVRIEKDTVMATSTQTNGLYALKTKKFLKKILDNSDVPSEQSDPSSDEDST